MNNVYDSSEIEESIQEHFNSPSFLELIIAFFEFFLYFLRKFHQSNSNTNVPLQQVHSTSITDYNVVILTACNTDMKNFHFPMYASAVDEINKRQNKFLFNIIGERVEK